jgi:hypothetical protein
MDAKPGDKVKVVTNKETIEGIVYPLWKFQEKTR